MLEVIYFLAFFSIFLGLSEVGSFTSNDTSIADVESLEKVRKNCINTFVISRCWLSSSNCFWDEIAWNHFMLKNSSQPGQEEMYKGGSQREPCEPSLPLLKKCLYKLYVAIIFMVTIIQMHAQSVSKIKIPLILYIIHCPFNK